MATATLMSLCNEILHRIFYFVDPRDLATLCCTCHALHGFIYSNTLLFKEHYLKLLDDPSWPEVAGEPRWWKQLTSYVKFQNILNSYQWREKRQNLKFVTKTVEELLRTAAKEDSKNIRTLRGLYASVRNEEIFLRQSTLFEKTAASWYDLDDALPTKDERQLSAKLHCLRGDALQYSIPGGDPLHPYARAVIYDLRHYTSKTKWGPFLDKEGPLQVDWEMVEMIMVLLTYNFKCFISRTGYIEENVWTTPFAGAAPNTFVSEPPRDLIQEPWIPLDLQDPYGITGTWKRIVCFLDYSDFRAFNDYPAEDSAARETLVTPEAIRLISMYFRVTAIEPPGPENGKELPIVHFVGRARSMHVLMDPTSVSTISGHVSLTPNGDVRWQTVSDFFGEPRWRSEGVQIGGPRSGRGVYGTWFDVNYDVDGPVGPTAFWKVTDKVISKLSHFDIEDDDL